MAVRAEFEKVKTNKQSAVRVPEKALRAPDVPRPGLRLRQFPRHHLPRTAPLEIDVLRAAEKLDGQQLGTCSRLITVDVDQFYGIEIEEFPAQIAQVAMWLTDHQMNLECQRNSANLFRAHPAGEAAPHRAWQCLADRLERVRAGRRAKLHVLGNPPFVANNTRAQNRRPTWPP
jgi:hypothetical protein